MLRSSSQPLIASVLPAATCIVAPSGVRSRNSAPWANSMKIAGQREISASSRPRQNS